MEISLSRRDGHYIRKGEGAGRHEVDKVVADEDDVKLNMSDIVVWIDPLDATQE